MMAWSRGRELALLAGILGLFVVSLGRTANYELVWDDVHEIQRNPAFDRPLVDGLGSTQTERTEPDLTELSTIQLAYDSYRPVVFASFWIDIRLWGRSAFALHLVNVILGTLAILVAHALTRRWVGAPLALIPTAMFALNPVQVETVAYVSGRGDLLAGLFAMTATLAALWSVDAERRRAACGWLGVAAVAFASSLLSKEAYIGLPLAVSSILWSEQRLRRRWYVPVTMLAVAGGYLALRAAIVSATTAGALSEAVLAIPGIVLEYVRIVILPFDLSTERLHQTTYIVPGWIAVGGALAVAVYRRMVAAKPLGRRLSQAVTGLGWMALLIAPSAVSIASMGVVADRYVYLPILGIGVAIASAGAGLAERQPRMRWPVAIVAITWAGLTQIVAWNQVPVWRDNPTLYAHAATMTPNSSKAHYRLGYLDAAAGRWDEAIERFEHAIILDPSNLLALNNLGVGYLRTHRYAEAAATLVRAVELNPAHFRAWFNLGLARLQLGDRTSGCASFDRALAINPHYDAARLEREQRCSPTAP